MATLKVIGEAKIHTFLPGCREESRLEASGVLAHEGRLIIIFDNLSEIARVDASFSPGAVSEWLGEHHGASGLEDIAYDKREQRFYALIEAVPVGKGRYRAVIVEYDHAFRPGERHSLPLDFAVDNKGFEGLTYVERNGQGYLLALCEGNRCKGGTAGRKPGGGRVHVFRRRPDGWDHVAELRLPKSVAFTDYASFDINDGRVVVLSQESSEVWVGTLDADAWKFVDEGGVHQLPRRGGGSVEYCNAEGVAWLAPNQIAVVSDKRKDAQRKQCQKKDQSLHVFQIA